MLLACTNFGQVVRKRKWPTLFQGGHTLKYAHICTQKDKENKQKHKHIEREQNKQQEKRTNNKRKEQKKQETTTTKQETKHNNHANLRQNIDW